VLDSIVDPRCPTGAGIVPTLGQLAIRYLANAVPGADPHGHEAWTFTRYLRWTAQKGPRGLAHALRCYGTLVARALAVGHTLRRAGRPALQREETERVLAALARPTVLRHRLATARALFLDRFVVLALWMAAVAGALWAGRFGLALGATAAALMAHRVLARRRSIDCRAKLARAARVLRHLMDVRYVVLGHSHGPACESLGEGSFYFNSGSWLESMQYVRILRDGSARLCEWKSGSAPTDAQRDSGLAGSAR